VSFLLDSDTSSAYLKGNRKVHGRVIQYGGQLHVSTVTMGELFAWALRARASPRRLLDLSDFPKDVTILDVDGAVARRYGEVQAAPLDVGRPAPGWI
jgi:predicted nucleic acid-binding protein